MKQWSFISIALVGLAMITVANIQLLEAEEKLETALQWKKDAELWRYMTDEAHIEEWADARCMIIVKKLADIEFEEEKENDEE